LRHAARGHGASNPQQRIRLDTFTTDTFAAPVTSGQSINYLIAAQYQDSDISLDPTTGNSPVVLQFYNSTNPSSPWPGPNNCGSTSNTFRDDAIAYQIKAGVAATTGSQVTPTPDAGWTGLWVVTVPFGASTLTGSNISQYTGAPILPSGLLQSILTSNLTYGIDNSTANVQASFPIPVATLTDGMEVWVKIKNANTGAATFTPNPGVISASPVVGGAHAALQGGELAANGRANFVWRQDISSWVLMECSGGAQQVAPATQGQHAPQMGQVAGVVGSARNLVMSVAAASASATLTADEIIVDTALGGVRYCLSSFNKTINLAGTNGAGAMDTGSAPVSGHVALYAINNPATQTAALLATNATSAAQPNAYGGANMPSGYTASAFVSVWPTNGSGQFVVGYQADRDTSIAPVIVLSTSTFQASLTPLAAVVPKNAKSISGTMSASSTQNTSCSISPIQAVQIGQQAINNSIGALGGVSASYKDVRL
jgi:hypothetical protein